jgi:hypothetical protein
MGETLDSSIVRVRISPNVSPAWEDWVLTNLLVGPGPRRQRPAEIQPAAEQQANARRAILAQDAELAQQQAKERARTLAQERADAQRQGRKPLLLMPTIEAPPAQVQPPATAWPAPVAAALTSGLVPDGADRPGVVRKRAEARFETIARSGSVEERALTLEDLIEEEDERVGAAVNLANPKARFDEVYRAYDKFAIDAQAIVDENEGFLLDLQQSLAPMTGMKATGWPADEAQSKAVSDMAEADLRTLESLKERVGTFKGGQENRRQALPTRLALYDRWSDIKDWLFAATKGDPVAAQHVHEYTDAQSKEHSRHGERYRDLDRQLDDTISRIFLPVDAASRASAVLAVLADRNRAATQAVVSFEEAVLAKHHGVRLEDCTFGTHNDKSVARANEKAGAGACNTVACLTYKNGQELFFKPEMRAERPIADSKQEQDPLWAIGIDRGNPRYGNRNIASRAVADAFGMDVLPQASFAMHNGKLGLLMERAEGAPPVGKQWDPVQPWHGAPTPEMEANLHSQLNSLEWCDLLTGQTDRHAQNYHVKVEGDAVKVTGIDNDRAFGSKERYILDGPMARYGIQSVGTPKLIDKQTLKKLKQMDFAEALLPKLVGLLTKEELDASEKRFNGAKAAAMQLDPQFVVDDWKTWRSPAPDLKTATEYLAEQRSGSLFQRDFAQFFPKNGVRTPELNPASPAPAKTAANPAPANGAQT